MIFSSKMQLVQHCGNNDVLVYCLLGIWSNLWYVKRKKVSCRLDSIEKVQKELNARENKI